MELVRIKGSRADLLRVRDSPDQQIVGSSAIDRGDGSWLVSVYVADDSAIERLRDRGLAVERLKPPEQVRSEFTAAAAAAGYLDSAALTDRLRSLASAHADVCELELLPNRTHAKCTPCGSGRGRRPWWSSGACMRANGRRRTRCCRSPRGWWAPTPAAARWSTRSGRTRRPIRRSPTPHGARRRATSSGSSTAPPWCSSRWSTRTVATSRSPDPTICTSCGARTAARRQRSTGGRGASASISTATSTSPGTSSATTPRRRPRRCDPASMPATRRSSSARRPPPSPRPRTCRHWSSGCVPRTSWTYTPTRGTSCSPGAWTTTRPVTRPRASTIPTGTAKGPITVATVLAAATASTCRRGWPLATRRSHDACATRSAIRPAATRPRHRSIYTVKQALGLYPTTGTSDDYCTALTMLDGSRLPIYAFTLECGIDQAPDDPTDNEGGFHPDYSTKFPKIEREVHAAVLALVRDAVGS